MPFVYKYIPKDRQGQCHAFSVVDFSGDDADFFDHPAVAWCQEQFGPETLLMRGSRWNKVGFAIYIANDDDAFAFRMRWC